MPGEDTRRPPSHAHESHALSRLKGRSCASNSDVEKEKPRKNEKRARAYVLLVPVKILGLVVPRFLSSVGAHDFFNLIARRRNASCAGLHRLRC